MARQYDNVVVGKRKLVEYILNNAHQEGATKAKYLAEIGYTTDTWRALRKVLLDLFARGNLRGKTVSEYGVKYEISGRIVGPSGSSRRVKTIWIVRHNERTMRFVTLIPEKKE